MRTTTRLAAAAAVGAAALAFAGAAPANAASSDATLSVLHGVPDTTVDVYLDGKRALNDFTPGRLAGPLDVPAGSHTIAITAADATNDDKPVIGPVDVTLAAGKSYTAAAHLTADGKPTATLYTDDISKVAAGKGRLTVRHTAAAPAVDVLANKQVAIEGLENPDEKVLELPAGTISAAVAAAGTTDPVIGPADVPVTEGANTIVYAWGSLKDKNLKVAVQTIKDLNGSPNGVNTGSAGLAAEQPGFTTAWSLAGLLALVAVGGTGATLAVRARRS
jgi:hypothetical protein